ncbi:MAG: pyridoxal-dependent decarboxylase [Actinomycetota bacterium]|nr:pyridoxal-dependent decarboxylase [Actinomycetota bacterium]
MAAPSYHMSPEDFRRNGHAIIDWLADYLAGVEQRRINPEVAPGDIRAMLPAKAPETPEPFQAILTDLDEIVMPGVVHWQSPGWFGYFPANGSGPGILGDLVSTGLGQQGMLWATGPACTEIETVVLDWLVDLLGVPAAWRTDGPGGGVIQMSASDSTHTALVVARHRASAAADPADLVAYTSAQAHWSVEKGARVAGYRHLRLIDVDGSYGMDPAALEAAVDADIAAGLIPAFVCSTVGTTATTAVDPVREVGEVGRRHAMWHHVDAAYAGTAMICPELRHHQDGLELVDSYTFNPHKWMFTNFDCSVFWVADRRPLLDALSMAPAFLRPGAADTVEVIDYRNWHVPLGRRFRALKLWFVLRSYGATGIRHHVRQHLEMAQWLTAQVEADQRLELVAPTPFGLVSFRHGSGDTATDAIAAAINGSGRFHVTSSRIDESSFVRVAIGQTTTEQRHVEALWDLVDQSA